MERGGFFHIGVFIGLVKFVFIAEFLPRVRSISGYMQ